MDEKKLKALATELAKGLKTEADLNQFSRMLTKLTVETALNAELTDHLGHEKNAPKSGSNTRNGYSSIKKHHPDGQPDFVPVCQRHDYAGNRCHVQRNVRRRCLAHADIQSDRCG